jgi:hypothetical protein
LAILLSSACLILFWSELRKVWGQTFLVENASRDQVEALKLLQAKYVQGGWHDDMFTFR